MSAARALYGYQQRAATFFYERDAAFLVAPLGAGKGAAALTALAELIRDGHHRHALVVAPKLVATTVWPLEVTLWPHLAHLRIAVLNGVPERRRALLACAGEREVTAIGVDLVPWLVSELAGLADDHPLFDVLIIDETSRLKDPSGKRARALLIAIQGARSVHDAPPFMSVVLLLVYRVQTDSSLCSGKPSAQAGKISISRRRIAFASSARVSSTSTTISS